MTLVMDGVGRVPGGTGEGVRRAPQTASKTPARPAAKPITAATSRATSGVRYVTGMDGVRRAVRVPQQPEPEPAPRRQQRPAQAPAARPERSYDGWRKAKPGFSWRRPLVGTALAGLALMASVVALRVVAPPKSTTAAADATNTPAVTAPSPTPSATPHKTGLQKLLNDFAAANPDKFGIVVKDLKTGETATYQSERQTESASLYKLFVARGIYQRIDIGQLKYSQAAGGGTGKTIDGCLTVMINISDNDCGRALGSILGWGAQNQALGLEGYHQTDLSTPQQTSAADVATLFERLYRGTLVSADSGGRFLSLLKSQRVNNRLPQGLPAGTVFAHKTGDLDGYVHDGGIVYGPKTDYLVVVTSGAWNSPAGAPPLFANLSGQLWNYFEQ